MALNPGQRPARSIAADRSIERSPAFTFYLLAGEFYLSPAALITL